MNIIILTGNIQNVLDYKLSRYACYSITQNADPRKEVIALGQTYFSIQTRKQELSEKAKEFNAKLALDKKKHEDDVKLKEKALKQKNTKK